MKLFSRSKPSTTGSVDGQVRDCTVTTDKQKMKDDERFLIEPSPSPARTPELQADRLERQNMKLGNGLSFPDLEKQTSTDIMLERLAQEFEDTDVWYTEESVECVIGAC